MDDVERLRVLLVAGKSELEVTRVTGWSHHRIKRIRERAWKDGRPLPARVKEGLNDEAPKADV